MKKRNRIGIKKRGCEKWDRIRKKEKKRGINYKDKNRMWNEQRTRDKEGIVRRVDK